MLKLLTILALTSSIAYGDLAYGFEKNISGIWKNNNKTWIIGQIGKNASFSTTEYSDDFGKQTYRFDGIIKSSGMIDSFVFSGEAKDQVFRIKDDICLIQLSLSSEGYVSGELGGRVINMTACNLYITLDCKSGIFNMESIDCSGVWK
jgi:hypothetical protein